MKSRAYILFLISLFYSNTSFTQELDRTRVIDKLPEIENYVRNEMEKRKIPGLVYGIFDRDSLLAIEAFGKADIQNNGPVIPETVFELASLTKQFTASAILLLQQDGKLTIDDLLKKHFPQCPEGWSSITLKHLLTHTSGLTASDDYPGINEMTGKRVRKEFADWSKQFIIDAIVAQELSHAPGEVYQYGDPAYALLGIVIDNITGSYRRFMKERIFDPAGMSSTYIVDQRTIHPNEARGYTLRNGEWINNRRYHNIEIPSWYGIFSNIEDLQKWDAALNSDKILSTSSKQLLWDNYTTNDGEKINYGLGWNIVKLGGYKIADHTGITGTHYLKILEKNISVITLTNLGYAGWDPVRPTGIANGIASILGIKIKIDSDYVTNDGLHVIPWPKERKESIIGDYTLSAEWGEGPVSIFEENGRVYISSMGMQFELGLLENGNYIHFDLEFEYILIADKSGDMISADGKDIYKKNKN